MKLSSQIRLGCGDGSSGERRARGEVARGSIGLAGRFLRGEMVTTGTCSFLFMLGIGSR